MLVIDVSFLRLKINEIEKSQLNHHQALFLFRPRAKRGGDLSFYTVCGYQTQGGGGGVTNLRISP